MHIFHCWHKIENSERKIPFNTRCKLVAQPRYVRGSGYVDYTIRQKCCICGKERKSTHYRDYDTRRAKEYKVDEDYKNL